MNYTIENDFLVASFVSLGAELKSLVRKSDGYEFIWQADPKWWGRSSPVLFPRIGFEENEYILKNSIPKHGHARDSEFSLIKQDSNSLSFRLDNDLVIIYSLLNNSLEVNYQVLCDHPFMIGAHPAFNIDPLNCTLTFSNDTYYKLKSGKIDYSKTYTKLSDDLKISPSTFADDALIFRNDYKHESVRLDDALIINHDSEFLGIWSPPNAPFVCIEPWWVKSLNNSQFIFTINTYDYAH